LLELNPQSFLQAAPDRALLAPACAEDFDLALIRHGQPFENLDGRGFSGAVGTEQAEALADCDGQVEAIHREHVVVSFDEPAAVDRSQAQPSFFSVFASVIADFRASSSCITRLFTPSPSPRIFML